MEHAGQECRALHGLQHDLCMLTEVAMNMTGNTDTTCMCCTMFAIAEYGRASRACVAYVPTLPSPISSPVQRRWVKHNTVEYIASYNMYLECRHGAAYVGSITT